MGFALVVFALGSNKTEYSVLLLYILIVTTNR